MKKNTPKINQGYDNMDDLREKVINGLVCCSHMSGTFCRKCPYENECKEGLLSGSAHLAANALSLLKAKEPVESIEMINDFYPIGDPLRTEGWKCGKCGQRIAWNDNYCSKCGTAVKW